MEFKVYEQLWFATPIWECPVIGIDNEEIKEYAHRVRKEKPGVNISNRGGWHSGELIEPLPTSLVELFNNLNEFVNEVPGRLMGMNNLELGNFWININGKYDYNMPHDHQKSILSGTYYVSVPDENMGDIVFHRDDTAEYFLHSGIQREETMVNARQVQKPAKEGTFYLFPSWVKHHVERNESDHERISIAFNFIQPEK